MFFFFSGCRDSLSAQLDLTVTKAESEQLARALQEEQYFELSQESKKSGARHKMEIIEKEAIISRVSMTSAPPPHSLDAHLCLERMSPHFMPQPKVQIVITVFCSSRNPIKL